LFPRDQHETCHHNANHADARDQQDVPQHGGPDVTCGTDGRPALGAHRLGRQQRIFATARLKDAIIIGIAQALALVPGTSRSGVTISAAMMLGFQRQDAARFSFLLSAPVIMLAAAFESSMLFVEETQFAWAQLAIGVTISAVVAYLSIDFFMRFVNVIGLLPFAIYRLVLAGVILYALV